MGKMKEKFGMKRFGFWALLLAAMFVIMTGGCGGSGSDDDNATLEGVFIDGPVEDLTYKCTPSGLSGKTDSNGTFLYKAEDKIVFTVGKISLPSVAGANVISPLSFLDENAEIDEERVLNFVCFIMSAGEVDEDGNIKIDANPFDGIEGTFPDVWDELVEGEKITVSPEKAEEHIKETLLKAYSGNYSGTWSGTYYYPGEPAVQISGTWKITIDEAGDV